jgi:NTE family protein
MNPAPSHRLGLALGSGAARGLAHIGVLKVLEAEQIAVDCIAGTSIGAFIGALYAAGTPVERMEDVARNVDWRQLSRLIDPILPTTSLLDGRKVGRFISELLPVRSFEDLRIPLAITATDVETGELLVIRKGGLEEALRAALAFPGIFPPVQVGKRFLVDGGLVNPVPIDVVRSLGATRVIGVCAIPEVEKRSTETSLAPKNPEPAKSPLRNVFTSGSVERLFREIWPGSDKEEPVAVEPERRPPNILRVCAQAIAIMENEINALRLSRYDADLLIRPDLNGLNLLDFHRAGDIIEAGVQATRPLVEKIRALHSANCTTQTLC